MRCFAETADAMAASRLSGVMSTHGYSLLLLRHVASFKKAWISRAISSLLLMVGILFAFAAKDDGLEDRTSC